MRLNEVYKNSGLGKWFHGESANKTPGWDRYNSKGELVGECGDAKKGSSYSACLSKQKADKLGKKGRANFVNRKRAAQSAAGRGKKGSGKKGKKPIFVKTGAAKMNECHECEQNLILEGKNKPNNPKKWNACKSAAKRKFDVYPSAYANAWAAKCYKKKGGTWRSVNEQTEIDMIKETVKENIIFNFMENAKPEFARRGTQQKQRPKSWSKGTKSGSDKRKMREEGKREARNLQEIVSIYNPLSSDTSSFVSRQSDDGIDISAKTKTIENKSVPSHSIQNRIIKHMETQEQNVYERQQEKISAPEIVNTEDTPETTGIRQALGTGLDTLSQQLSSASLENDRLQSELKSLRTQRAQELEQENARKAEAATRRKAKKQNQDSRQQKLPYPEPPEPGLFDNI